MATSSHSETTEHVMGLEENEKEDEVKGESTVSSRTASILTKLRLEHCERLGKEVMALAENPDFMDNLRLKDEEKKKLLFKYVSWDDPKKEWPITMKKKTYRSLFNHERDIVRYRKLIRKLIPCLEIGLCMKFSCGLAVPCCPNPQKFEDSTVKGMSLKTFLEDMSMKEYTIKLTRKPAETWEDAEDIMDKFLRKKSRQNSLIMILLSDEFVNKNVLHMDQQKVRRFVREIELKDLHVIIVMKGDADVVDSMSTTL